MNDGLLVAVRHSCWGTMTLLDFCKGLPPDQLEWSVPGTYGSVERTLRHIVAADQGYLLALTGTMPAEPRADPNAPIPLDELVAKEKAVLESAERLLAQPFDASRAVVRPTTTTTAGIVIAQLVHHGTDHRTQIATTLSAHGVEPPDLQVWSYGRTIGQVS